MWWWFPTEVQLVQQEQNHGRSRCEKLCLSGLLSGNNYRLPSFQNFLNCFDISYRFGDKRDLFFLTVCLTVYYNFAKPKRIFALKVKIRQIFEIFLYLRRDTYCSQSLLPLFVINRNKSKSVVRLPNWTQISGLLYVPMGVPGF